MKKRAGLLLGIFCLLPSWCLAQDRQEILQLDRAGATDLAMSLIDARQKPFAQDIASWLQWEELRLELLLQRGRWQEYERRIEALPARLPQWFLIWAKTQGAQLHLLLNDPQRARRLLADLIWQIDDGEAVYRTALWRRMIIESYLQEERYTDSAAAMVKYQQEYGDTDEAWLIMRARVLMRQNGAPEAAIILEGTTQLEARIYYLTAQLRAREKSGSQIWSQAKALLAQTEDKGYRLALLLLCVEAAHAAAQPEQEIEALEQANALADSHNELVGLYHFSVDQLWSSYFSLAQSLANTAQLLEGDDSAWLTLVTSLRESQPVQARALLAYLAFKALDGDVRSQSHAQLFQSLVSLPGGRSILHRLYLQSEHFKETTAIPSIVRYELLDDAIAANDLKLASALIVDLDTPPVAQENRLDWRLRQARIHVMAGQHGQGVMILQAILADTSQRLDEEFVDRFLQVLFDLQTVDQHKVALDLFEQLLQRQDIDHKHRREAYYWMADSFKALRRYQEAARLYMQSALWGGEDGQDMWGQSARFQAAGMLASAGFVDDARSVYLELLRVAADPGRKALLQRSIQQLLLIQRKRGRG